MFLQETDLNVVPGGIIPVMHVSQYDVGRELKFVLYSGYDYASLESGTTVTIEGTKPDGHGFQYSGVLDQNAHTATFVTTEQMTVLAGAIECKLTLYLNSQRIGTALFILDVEKAGINDSTIISNTELPLIIAQATEQMERAEAAADAAALSETNAATSETNAAASETNAANSEIICGSFMRMAGVSAASAEQSAIISGSFMRTAGNYADEAEASAASASVDALKSEGHAIGTQNGTPVSSDSPYYHNNAKYWADEARQSSAGGVAARVIATAEPTNISTHAYAIGDQFVYNGILYTATSAISVGATITPGTNCSISDTITEQIGNAGKVTGVKGSAESTYRTGNVNISPADIGLGNVDNTADADKPVSTATQTALNGKVSTDGASTNTTVAFTSNDLAANTTAKTDTTANQPSTVPKLTSGETLGSVFGKLSSMFASIRKLWNTVGTSNLSTKLGTTVTGTVNTLNTNLVATYNGNNVPFKFGIDADGNYGYIKAGADTVIPFRNFDNVKYGIGTYSVSGANAGVYIYTMPNGYDSSISMQSYSANSPALKTFDIFKFEYFANSGDGYYQITALVDIYVGNELVKKNHYKKWNYYVYRFYPIALAK